MSEQWLPSASDQEDMQGPTVQELQDALAQQAQEIDRVTKECNHQTRQRVYELEKSLKQAQEIERLERQLELDAQQIQAVRDQCKPYTDMRDHVVEMVVEVVNKLAAMTTERDEAIGHLQAVDHRWSRKDINELEQQLATAQARCRELEAELIKWQQPFDADMLKEVE